MKKSYIFLSTLWAVIGVGLLILPRYLTTLTVNNYYVSTAGNDANNGQTPTTPWRHIQKAINSFILNSGGATINVSPGLYNDEYTSNCSGSSAIICISRGGSSSIAPLRLVCTQQWTVPSSGGCRVRFPAGATTTLGFSTVWLGPANYVEFGALNQFGFDLSMTDYSNGISSFCSVPNGSTGNCSSANGLHILGNYWHDMSSAITTCEVNPNGHPVIVVQIHHGAYITDLQVIGNRITDSGPQSLSALNGGPGCINYYAMYIDNQASIVENNIITNIAGYGIHYYSAPCQGSISNNTIQRTEYPSIIVGGGDCNNGIPQGSVTVSNNILGQTGPGQQNLIIGVPGGSGIGSSTHPILVTNNVFSGGAAGQFLCVVPCFATNANAKSEAPTSTFVNYTGGNNDDFHLRGGSIAIKGGIPSCALNGLSPCNSTADFSLNAWASPNRSIGAYEYASAPASPPSAPTSLQVTVQ